MPFSEIAFYERFAAVLTPYPVREACSRIVLGLPQIVEFPQWKQPPAYGKCSGVLAQLQQARYRKYSKYLKYPSHSGTACGRKSAVSNRLKTLLRREYVDSSSSSSSSSIPFSAPRQTFPKNCAKAVPKLCQNYLFVPLPPQPDYCLPLITDYSLPAKTQPFPHRNQGGR
jgi:hypothetical protein